MLLSLLLERSEPGGLGGTNINKTVWIGLEWRGAGWRAEMGLL